MNRNSLENLESEEQDVVPFGLRDCDTNVCLSPLEGTMDSLETLFIMKDESVNNSMRTPLDKENFRLMV